MTGMERNSDHVAMAAFAPLLSHSQDPACPHDLVIFDNHRFEQHIQYLVHTAAAQEAWCHARLLLLHQHVLHENMLAVLSNTYQPILQDCICAIRSNTAGSCSVMTEHHHKFCPAKNKVQAYAGM